VVSSSIFCTTLSDLRCDYGTVVSHLHWLRMHVSSPVLVSGASYILGRLKLVALHGCAGLAFALFFYLVIDTFPTPSEGRLNRGNFMSLLADFLLGY